MSAEASRPAAAVPGLIRSDPHGPGIHRERTSGGFRYRDSSGAEVSDPETMQRIAALRIPPAWNDVWISADPLGHIQATGIDSRGRTQYRYHHVWREQRDAQKFAHMLRFAEALPVLRSATVRDLGRRQLSHFTAKEFRTWNATVLMALQLANADPAPTARGRKSAIVAGVRGVAEWLGDTPTVARSSYIDPRVIIRYESDGQLTAIPRLPAVLPAAAEAEIAVAALLAADTIEPGGGHHVPFGPNKDLPGGTVT